MSSISLSGVDVGLPKLAGKFTAGPKLEVVGGGADIWGTQDQFHFAQARIGGDFELSVRVESLEMADLYTKAGLMVRASLEPGAEHALLLAFGSNAPRNNNNGGLEFQYRLTTGAACTGVYPPQPLPAAPDFPADFPNVWLKLSRSGAIITGEYSRDGRTWKQYAQYRHALSLLAHVGLAVTSHHPDKTVKAVFSDLKFSGLVWTGR